MKSVTKSYDLLHFEKTSNHQLAVQLATNGSLQIILE